MLPPSIGQAPPPQIKQSRHAVADVRGRIEQLYQRLKRSPKTTPLFAVAERFVEIDGVTEGGLLSVQLFVTVIPLIIIGFAYFSGFGENSSVGELFIRRLGLHHPLDNRVREAFGSSSGIVSVWTFFGIAGFLVWGIPMSSKVAAMFARAWRSRPFGRVEQLARGATWFVLYLGTLFAHESVAFGAQRVAESRAAFLVLALVPVWIFWSLTPVLLVRKDTWAWRTVAVVGLAGVVIDGIILAAVVRVGFPVLLEGWSGFGPMGVAMTLMTWCGVLATGWVVNACAGAVLWERTAPAQALNQSETPQANSTENQSPSDHAQQSE